jgi:hypothetical protein
MITAQTITRKYHKDAHCIRAAQTDGLGTDYYLIVDDGEDSPILAWGYSIEEAWDEAAATLLDKAVRNHVRTARKEAFTEAIAIVREQQRGPEPSDFKETFTRLEACSLQGDIQDIADSAQRAANPVRRTVEDAAPIRSMAA